MGAHADDDCAAWTPAPAALATGGSASCRKLPDAPAPTDSPTPSSYEKRQP
ncbi:hypothetical protein [Streptomyces lydicus]|uniref:hypothetical protein n=1 Tax=Streptomyces lydicus TaxID=47763 RepID=UPI0013E35946|nr:hypothetical protein [Streptomyces lydicus]